jgi:hypothetical protein
MAIEPAYAVDALQKVKRRLQHDSTIMFLQRGMDVTEKVSKHVFPDVTTRPNYITAVMAHSVFSKSLHKNADWTKLELDRGLLFHPLIWYVKFCP